MDDYIESVNKRRAALSRAPRAAGGAGLGGAALVNNTNSQAKKKVTICPETGVVIEFARDSKCNEDREIKDKNLASNQARSARFSAQTSASKLLFNHDNPVGKQWRVTGCTRRKISEDVAVLYTPAIKKAHFSGLMICGSVWTCPPCAAKISERRKIEIEQATDIHTEAGGVMYMLTFTFPHYRSDDLSVILKKFSKSLEGMRGHRDYKDLKLDAKYIGEIKCLEVTYSDKNGFHPHQHTLWLVEKEWSSRKLILIRNTLYRLLKRYCLNNDLPAPNRKRGVHIKRMYSAADYIAKFGVKQNWGTGSELTKQHSKVGVKSLTPFDLLRKYQDGEKRFGPIFIKYAEAFFRKRQVVWSDGLKKLFFIEEKSDQEIAEEQSEDSVVLVRMSAHVWKVVLSQPYDRRSVLLELAESSPVEVLEKYLFDLCQGVPF